MIRIKNNVDIIGDFSRKKKEVLDKLVSNTPIDTGEARAGWKATREGIENSVEHISALNSGTSKQAPSHFIEKTILSVDGIVPEGVIVTES